MSESKQASPQRTLKRRANLDAVGTGGPRDDPPEPCGDPREKKAARRDGGGDGGDCRRGAGGEMRRGKRSARIAASALTLADVTADLTFTVHGTEDERVIYEAASLRFPRQGPGRKVRIEDAFMSGNHRRNPRGEHLGDKRRMLQVEGQHSEMVGLGLRFVIFCANLTGRPFQIRATEPEEGCDDRDYGDCGARHRVSLCVRGVAPIFLKALIEHRASTGGLDLTVSQLRLSDPVDKEVWMAEFDLSTAIKVVDHFLPLEREKKGSLPDNLAEICEGVFGEEDFRWRNNHTLQHNKRYHLCPSSLIMRYGLLAPRLSEAGARDVFDGRGHIEEMSHEKISPDVFCTSADRPFLRTKGLAQCLLAFMDTTMFEDGKLKKVFFYVRFRHEDKARGVEESKGITLVYFDKEISRYCRGFKGGQKLLDYMDSDLDEKSMKGMLESVSDQLTRSAKRGTRDTIPGINLGIAECRRLLANLERNQLLFETLLNSMMILNDLQRATKVQLLTEGAFYRLVKKMTDDSFGAVIDRLAKLAKDIQAKPHPMKAGRVLLEAEGLNEGAGVRNFAALILLLLTSYAKQAKRVTGGRKDGSARLEALKDHCRPKIMYPITGSEQDLVSLLAMTLSGFSWNRDGGIREPITPPVHLNLNTAAVETNATTGANRALMQAIEDHAAIRRMRVPKILLPPESPEDIDLLQSDISNPELQREYCDYLDLLLDINLRGTDGIYTEGERFGETREEATLEHFVLESYRVNEERAREGGNPDAEVSSPPYLICTALEQNGGFRYPCIMPTALTAFCGMIKDIWQRVLTGRIKNFEGFVKSLNDQKKLLLKKHLLDGLRGVGASKVCLMTYDGSHASSTMNSAAIFTLFRFLAEEVGDILFWNEPQPRGLDWTFGGKRSLSFKKAFSFIPAGEKVYSMPSPNELPRLHRPKSAIYKEGMDQDCRSREYVTQKKLHARQHGHVIIPSAKDYSLLKTLIAFDRPVRVSELVGARDGGSKSTWDGGQKQEDGPKSTWEGGPKSTWDGRPPRPPPGLPEPTRAGCWSDRTDQA